MNNIKSRVLLLLSVSFVMLSLHACQETVETGQPVQETNEILDQPDNQSNKQVELNEQLGFAIWFNNDDEIRNLINMGADINAVCSVGDMKYYPLGGVLERKRNKQWNTRQKSGKEDFELVKFLVEHGAEIEKGPSVLLLAIMLGNYTIVQFLLDYGLDIEAKVVEGNRSLNVFDFLINGIDFGHSYADVMLIIVALVNAVVKKDPAIDKNKLTTAVLTACTKKIRVIMKLEEAAKKFEKRDC